MALQRDFQMIEQAHQSRLHTALPLRRLSVMALPEIVLIVLWLVVVSHGCRPATEVQQPSRTQFITGTSWIVRSTIPNVNDLIQAVFIFTRDGVFQYITPDGNIAALGRWTFTDNETRVNVVVSSTNTLQMDIMTLTAQEFRFRLSVNGAIIECSCVPLR